MNDYQKRRFSKNIVKTLYNTLSGKKIALLGWSFKKDTNDSRESPAIYVANDLIEEQANLVVFDPKVEENQIYSDLNSLKSRSEIENIKGLKVSSNYVDACKDAHAILIVTEWDIFKSYDWKKIFDQMQKPAFIFDGRNLLNKKELEQIGFIYKAIGS
jgi:UDPglucose 6-dehydrogenase